MKVIRSHNLIVVLNTTLLERMFLKTQGYKTSRTLHRKLIMFKRDNNDKSVQ